MVNPIALILVASIAVLCAWKWRNSVNRRAYPPGPSTHPLVGNYLQFPKVSPWVTYAKWAKKYGDVISLSAFGNCIVIVNSAKAASAIFDKRGALYSDRPHNVMAQDLIKNPGIAFLSYTETFRLQRKLFTTGLNSAAMADYRPIQEKESYALLDRLLESPDKYYKHVRRTAGAVILKIAYGHSVVTDDDYFIQLAEAVVTHLRNSLQPDAFLVNLIPALKHIPAWMPFTAFHRFARMVRQLDTNLHELPFNVVKSQILEGVAPLSYTSKLLNASELITDRDPTEMEEYIKTTAASFYGAGADTTVFPIITFILAMVLHPEVQRKAQAEMDAVVGGSRLPTLADKSSLPYLECILSEVLRWYPVSPLGIPHCARRDDVYEGYLIPEGAVVMGNIWAMVNDEEVYQDPRKFWPERFDGRFPMIPDPRHFVFGFGRRICPGRHLANESVFIAIACLISAYSFSKALGRDGKEIEPNIGYSPVTGALQPFECQISPRSPETVALIKATQSAYGP